MLRDLVYIKIFFYTSQEKKKLVIISYSNSFFENNFHAIHIQLF